MHNMFINIHFIILVVSNRTVQTSKSILRILSGSEVIVSEIIKQTSSDRSHVPRYFRELEQGRFDSTN